MSKPKTPGQALAEGLEEANRVEKELDAKDQAEDAVRNDQIAERIAAQQR